MSLTAEQRRKNFRTKRKDPVKKTVESFIESRSLMSNTAKKTAKQISMILNHLTKTNYSLSANEWISEMQQISQSEDITDDLKEMNQILWNYCGETKGDCLYCDEKGLIPNPAYYGSRRKCSSCHGTNKKRVINYGSKIMYLSHFTELLRHCNLLKMVEEKLIKPKKEKKIKLRRKKITKGQLKLILDYCDKPRKEIFKFLAYSGLRVEESLGLQTKNIYFIDENGLETKRDNRCRVAIAVEATTTKTKSEHFVIVHKELESMILKSLDSGLDRILNISSVSLREYLKSLREKMGADDHYFMTEIYPDTERHKFTLHSLRSYFITQSNKAGDSFGHYRAGHESIDELKVIYDRKGDDEIMNMWFKAEDLLTIDEKPQDKEAIRAEIREELREELKAEVKEEVQRELQPVFEEILADRISEELEKIDKNR